MSYYLIAVGVLIIVWLIWAKEERDLERARREKEEQNK